MAKSALGLRTHRTLSRSIEDYLKTIHDLESETTTALTTAIAERLGVEPQSVTGMLKRLADTGLLRHQPYHGVRLTHAGRRLARKVVRRHRILESYLVANLGFDWDTVHDEAERLEHAASDRLIDRMAAALGHPRYDPHGEPIPTTAGEIERPHLTPLSDFPVGDVAELRMVGDTEPDRLRYLASIGLRPGRTFEVLSRRPFRGPITIRLGRPTPRKETIGHELASSLWCAVAERRR
jgi:DtxR family Mn-dependent transcriptional regulator